ncbi:response regulator transcription factor [Allokutzneria sp. A3M-2-11 16]|uniref:response regulator n=1 Tax=Allokutzneria sp. A3M-2-11 16 TaxID=2962043 RepID=UPI0020B8F6C3|nr:response regulator transcription factor [Allokutzneria sp. A3M-2-11 16]MCP3804875.1 response regulator transcription factor [Allokutzneria sp. A3M-2-11 16]
MIRLVVVDDHPVVRDGLRGMLAGQADLEVVGEAENGRAALDVVARELPDVVLMDLRMPVLDGVGAIERLSSAHPSVRVLVLTTYDEDAEIIRAVEAGATGCLLKDAPREVLFRAVRAAARGEPVLAPGLTAKLLGRLRGPQPESLTDREVEVLGLVAKGLTNRAIGRELAISEATVKTHLVHAFTKLDVDDRTAAVTVALERGLLRLNQR